MPKSAKQFLQFYITTAIDYVNGDPHIGHALEKIQADVVARHHRILGDDVFFLAGTDENSLKNVQAAEKEGIAVKELVDRNAKRFYDLKDILNLSFDDFIRTTEKRHILGVEKLWNACQKDIYKKKYQGLYCVGCETFLTESELIDGLCPEHKKAPELIEEENYFFKLSKYQEELKKLIETDKFKIIPQTRKNEVLSFINSGLEDICISRSIERAHGWGIPVPGDSSQVIWVWFDALANYITAVGYGSDEKRFTKLWPANLHIIGKGILRFHAVHWPAILLSAGIGLPQSLFVHGYITVDGTKMSKSLGNVINPFDLVKKYGTEPVRYFLLREMPPTQDGDFTYEKFEERYESDLAKGLGNLVARIITLANKLNIDKTGNDIENAQIKQAAKEAQTECNNALLELRFNDSLVAIWQLIGSCDKHIEQTKPWEQSANQKAVIKDLLAALNYIAKMLEPFLPQTSEKILKQIKERKGDILFPQF
jgi:methionyl-tRNA synthetase